jgi:short subunit fatty acids transporter
VHKGEHYKTRNFEEFSMLWYLGIAGIKASSVVGIDCLQSIVSGVVIAQQAAFDPFH